MDLIGTYSCYLPEYTDTVNAEIVDTGIDVSATNYAHGIVVVQCDGIPTENLEWGGLSISNFARYVTNRNLVVGTQLSYRKKQNRSHLQTTPLLAHQIHS